MDVLFPHGRRVLEFVGEGIVGFLINPPIVSYFEVVTILTPNHGHAATMGVLGLMSFVMRETVRDKR